MTSEPVRAKGYRGHWGHSGGRKMTVRELPVQQEFARRQELVLRG
jgi:hypothetical protein